MRLCVDNDLSYLPWNFRIISYTLSIFFNNLRKFFSIVSLNFASCLSILLSFLNFYYIYWNYLVCQSYILIFNTLVLILCCERLSGTGLLHSIFCDTIHVFYNLFYSVKFSKHIFHVHTSFSDIRFLSSWLPALVA